MRHYTLVESCIRETDAPAAKFMFSERTRRRQLQRELAEPQRELLPAQAGAGAVPAGTRCGAGAAAAAGAGSGSRGAGQGQAAGAGARARAREHTALCTMTPAHAAARAPVCPTRWTTPRAAPTHAAGGARARSRC